MKKTAIHSFALAALAFTANGAQAAVAHDQNVTNNVIMGTGITNGGFTVDTAGGVEVGLRARVRHDTTTNLPTNVTNSNGDGTFSHAAGEPPGFGGAGQNRARWNFDWSINTGTAPVSAYTYRLGMDFDAGFGTNFLTFDLINAVNPAPAEGGFASWDHSFGNNGTAQSAGVEFVGGTAADRFANYTALKAANNLVQNSWNYDFFDSVFAFDPTVDGNYSIFLEVISTAGQVLARSDIEVIVGAGATRVPEPGSLALAGLALAGLAAARRRQSA